MKLSQFASLMEGYEFYLGLADYETTKELRELLVHWSNRFACAARQDHPVWTALEKLHNQVLASVKQGEDDDDYRRWRSYKDASELFALRSRVYRLHMFADNDRRPAL